MFRCVFLDDQIYPCLAGLIAAYRNIYMSVNTRMEILRALTVATDNFFYNAYKHHSPAEVFHPVLSGSWPNSSLGEVFWTPLSHPHPRSLWDVPLQPLRSEITTTDSLRCDNNRIK